MAQMKNKCHGCHFAVTGVTPTHCCNGCAMRPGNHGPHCKQIVFQQPKCQGCHFSVTGVTPTHCCRGCQMRPGSHGPACKQVVHHHHQHHHHHHHHHHHAHANVTVAPVLTGVWMADQGAANQTSIAQAGNNITCTNPGQAWSPATGVVHANRTVTFQTGLVGITGTFDGFNKLVFSNGCSWTKTA